MDKETLDIIGKYCYLDKQIFTIESINIFLESSKSDKVSVKLRHLRTQAIRTTALCHIKILEGDLDSINLESLKVLYG